MASLKALLDDLLNKQEMSIGDVLDRHLAAGYRQRTDGAWSNRDEVGEHFAHLRSVVASIDVTVFEELLEGGFYAERHLADIRKRDGGQVVQEVYCFGDVDGDDRFSRIEEMTLMLEGAEADRAIGSAR